MGRVVIACYKPKPEKADALRALMKEHLPILRSQGLVTERDSIVMEAKDGTIVEVFEWKSQEAIEAAHSNATVLNMWERYGAVCEYIPISKLEEASQRFSQFAPLEK